MAVKNKLNKKVVIILAIVAALLLLSAFFVTYSVKQSSKNAQIKKLTEAIVQAEQTPKILQGSVTAYEAFRDETSDQSAYGYNPGFGALDDVSFFIHETPDEWTKRCNFGFNDRLQAVLDRQQESVGKLSGSDQKLLEEWNDATTKVVDWVMCYQGALVYNKIQAKNGIDDFKSVSLKMKGRVATLNEAIEGKKEALNEIEPKDPLFL